MGKLGGGREFGKKISFVGKLGTENEKAIDSIAPTLMPLFAL